MNSIILPLLVCNINPELLRTWNAVCWVESRGDPCATNPRENAVGIAQIRPVMVRDVNRIAGRAQFTLADRTDPAKSYQMFRLYCLHYYPKGTPEQWARAWCGGPDGPKQAATEKYWEKVNFFLDKGL